MNDKKIKVKISCLHDMPPLLRQLPDKSTILSIGINLLTD